MPAESDGKPCQDGDDQADLSWESMTPPQALDTDPHAGPLWFFQCMDRINRAIQKPGGTEHMMNHVLGATLEVFKCDRAFLLYPCDPEAPSWRVPMERTTPEFPGVFAMGIDVPMEPDMVSFLKTLQSSEKPVRLGPGGSAPSEIAVKRFGIQSQIATAIHPRNDRPYVFGLQQCSYRRDWTLDEERLFESVGRRIADALGALIAFRALRASEARLAQAQRVAHVGHWETDLLTGRIIWSNETYRIVGLEPQEKELTLADVLRMTHPDDRKIQNAAIERAVERGERYDVEYRIVRPDGEVRFVHTQGEVTKDESGRPVHSFGVVQDITERHRAQERLRASEARLRVFIDHAGEAFFLHEIEGAILDLNQRACEQLGYTREELIGVHLQDIDVVNDPEFLKQIEVRLASGERVSFDSVHRRKDGSVFPVEVRISPFREGGHTYAVSEARDVSERKRSEGALRLFRSLIDRTHDAIEVIDPATGRILDVNERACQRHGYTREEYLALTVGEIDPVVGSLDWRNWVEELRLSGSKVFEGVHRCKDGTLLAVEVNSNFIQLDREYLVSVVRDVTERKRAHEAVRQAEQKYRRIFDNAIEGIFQTSPEGRLLTANPALARILGYDSPNHLIASATDMVGQLFVDPSAREKYLEELWNRGLVQGFECELHRHDGGKAWVSLSTRVTTDNKGKPLYCEGLVEEITNRKRLEEEFRQAQKMEAIGRLAGGVAHDFNNLLTVITGYSELILSRLRPDDPNKALLAEILKSGHRAAKLTRQLLAFSRKQVLQPQVVSVNASLTELHNLLQRLIGEDIELDVVLDASRDLTRLDPGQFEQAIVNMAVNARDAMPSGGSLTIETRNMSPGKTSGDVAEKLTDREYVQVVVRDTGHGMDEATAAHVFEPFFTTKPQGKGTGLGLAMVYGFVKQSGGQVEVQSEPSGGTAFMIYLPVVSPAEAPGRPTREPLSQEGRETVLLVEDEVSLRDLLSMVLRSKGYGVLEAEDGKRALEIADEHEGPIELLLTDVMMPGMSGRQVADQLGRSRPEVRILFMSGYTDEAVLERGVRSSHVGFLQKPFRADELADKVREVLESDPSSG